MDDPELTKLQQLRQQTTRLISQLRDNDTSWESEKYLQTIQRAISARNKRATASSASPSRGILSNSPERRGRSEIASNRSSPTKVTFAPELSFSRDQGTYTETHVDAQVQAGIAEGEEVPLEEEEIETTIIIGKNERAESPSRRSSVSRRIQARSPSRSRSRDGSPARCSSPWSRFQTGSFVERNQVYFNPLERSEEYFRELSNFRKQFPEEFYGNSERILDIPLQPSTREGVENDLELPPPNDTHIRTGYFSINDRLFPVPSKNAVSFGEFGKTNEIGLLKEELLPVKVSIPHSKVLNIRRKFVPHTRESYDPHGSVNIASYLQKGYEPFAKDTLTLKHDSENVGLKYEQRKRTVNEARAGQVEDIEFR